MTIEFHPSLTASDGSRRVDPVAELSTLTPDDRRILGLPNTRAARHRVAPFVTLALPEVQKLQGALPSYVSVAVTALVDAFKRWERDEYEVVNGRS